MGLDIPRILKRSVLFKSIAENKRNMHVHELDPESAGENAVLCEAFEWHLPADHKHWKRLRLALPSLKAIGIDHLWLPPGAKAKDLESNGYDIYDPYDLGEFNQKGGIPTKWGTKEDLTELAVECKRMKMGMIWDAIFNHRGYADGTEIVTVVEVDQNGNFARIDKYNHESRLIRIQPAQHQLQIHSKLRHGRDLTSKPGMGSTAA